MRLIILCMMFFPLFIGEAFANHACNNKVYKAVAEHYVDLKLTAAQLQADTISNTCKFWPYNNNIQLSVIAYRNHDNDAVLLVSMIDNGGYHVTNGYSRIVEEDAVIQIMEDSFELDTARYQLSDNIRAFGLRFHSGSPGASCANAYFNNFLTLFVPEQISLRPVLDIAMLSQRFSEDDECHFSEMSESAQLIIALEQGMTNGFSDLRVKADILKNTLQKNTFEFDTERYTESAKLTYDGKRYSLEKTPWWLLLWKY